MVAEHFASIHRRRRLGSGTSRQSDVGQAASMTEPGDQTWSEPGTDSTQTQGHTGLGHTDPLLRQEAGRLDSRSGRKG